MQKKAQRGSGMIEILIATAVVGLVMTAVAAGLILSIKNSAVSKNKIFASTRAQEAMEVFRRERVLLGWSQFQDAANTDTYCLNDLPADSAAFIAMPGGTCTGVLQTLNGDFIREAVVNVVSADQVNVEIIVSWQDIDIARSTSLIQEFKRYE